MIVDFIRMLLWLLLCLVVAIIEYSTGLPVLSIALILMAVASFSTIFFVTFVSLITLLLAALFMESWLILWVLIMICSLLFRMKSTKSRQTLLTRMSIVVIAALVISMLREPTVTISFLIHSLVSICIAGYLLWKKIMPKSKGLDIAELRFMSEE